MLAAAMFSLDRVTASLDPLNTSDPLNTLDPLNSLDELDTILHNYKHSVLSDQEVEMFDEAVNSVEGDMDSARSRVRRARRAMPTMYMDKKKKLRTCANMNGILGGSNAFNYVSFVLAILTLVVNTNNNINNNNNNLNQANLNTASNNNANANSNNNNANVINVMPPGKKKRRRKRSPHPFDVFEDRICVKSQQSSVSGELSLASMVLVQGYLRSLTSDRCRQPRLCRSLAEAARLGLGGRLLVTAVRAAAAATEAVEMDCDDHDTTEEECDGDGDEAEHKIQCAQCGHTVSTSADIVNIHTDHALSSGQVLLSVFISQLSQYNVSQLNFKFKNRYIHNSLGAASILHNHFLGCFTPLGG